MWIPVPEPVPHKDPCLGPQLNLKEWLARPLLSSRANGTKAFWVLRCFGRSAENKRTRQEGRQLKNKKKRRGKLGANDACWRHTSCGRVIRFEGNNGEIMLHRETIRGMPRPNRNKFYSIATMHWAKRKSRKSENTNFLWNLKHSIFYIYWNGFVIYLSGDMGIASAPLMSEDWRKKSN